jgi:ubiquitin C-terminal hydrolase
LCIHILRTSWTGGASAKRTEFVRFPERLNLFTTRRMTNQYISTDIDYESRDKDNSEVGLRRFKNLQYRLVAVISHYGDSDSGHFITYRRSPPKTQNDKSEA